ncbi:hypothetical protein N7474_010263 [Penicillium riverlandense]|uniref:uncharacterized protein n=1 Tax=Penicillium riverlandense TaxID=1903569 RepID=UPI0025470E04|nr:uncharacterized protein N7474_010263 [Penicillium riverlandense]KAJ5808994.1 hypothetical protein N7474_010263 [Penicillium riverlandense]
MSPHSSAPSDHFPLWDTIAQSKRAARDAAIPSVWQLRPDQIPDDQLDVTGVPADCGILTDKEVEITETDATVLVQKLVNRDYSSHEVGGLALDSYLYQVNCLSEIFFDRALEAAEHLDTEYAASGIPSGPLHGLPISLKDCFKVEGTDATIGYTAFANQPTAEEDESEVTKILRDSGAVLYCKTNVPIALMSGETHNAIYGYTSNPYNRNMSSGGSSGGESALLALKGAPLGVGTDVGGSVRIPASFCGLYSLKPSFGRFPTYGIQDGLKGQEAVRNAIGPMAKSLDGVEIWSKAVLKSEPWMNGDPDCLPIPWRDVQVPKKLCFGLLLDDGIVKPLPPVTRGLLLTKAALEAAGHTVIEFRIIDELSEEPLFLDTLKHVLYRSATAELIGGTLRKTNEPWPRGYELLADMLGHSSNGELSANDPATVSDLWKAQTQRTKFAKGILQSWAATKIRTETGREMDALLMPCSPWPASPKHGFIYDNYTSLWNVLDYCATTLPVTKVSSVEDLRPEYKGRNELEAQVWENYSPEHMIGCPVAVQLVGRRLNEEYILGVTRACDAALRDAAWVSS